jgi:arginase family enzyme
VHGPGGVIWVDAHGDLNTPETSRPATSTAWCWLRRSTWPAMRSYDDWTLPRSAGKLALVGVRSLDGESVTLKRLGRRCSR